MHIRSIYMYMYIVFSMQTGTNAANALKKIVFSFIMQHRVHETMAQIQQNFDSPKYLNPAGEEAEKTAAEKSGGGGHSLNTSFSTLAAEET